MKFTDERIDLLRERVRALLSDRRFAHILGVENTAALIGGYLMADRVDELRVAALLHDISKEYSEAEYFDVIKKYNIHMSHEDLASPSLWHSIAAPYVIMSEFDEFADADVLSAVANHTVGCSDMTVFDEIILLADYIEEGRKYPACVSLREKFILQLAQSDGNEERMLIALHSAVVESFDNTIAQLSERGEFIHPRTISTRDAILNKIERLNNGSY